MGMQTGGRNSKADNQRYERDKSIEDFYKQVQRDNEIDYLKERISRLEELMAQLTESVEG